MCKKCSIVFCALIVGVLCLCMSSCIKEDLSHCDNNIYLYVKIAEASKPSENSELKGEMEDALLYIFDEQGFFIKTQRVSKESIEKEQAVVLELDEYYKSLSIYSWGNLDDEKEQITLYRPGFNIDYGRIRLETRDRIDSSYFSPSDLFYGDIKEFSTRIYPDKKTEYVIEMNRKVAGIIITTEGLREYAKTADTNFSYRIGKTSTSYTFDAKKIGSKGYYKPNSNFSQDLMKFKTSIFNVIPSDTSAMADNMELEIYHGDKVIYVVKEDDQGKPLKTIENKLLNIYIKFNGLDLDVYVSITPWGIIDQIVEIK